MSINGTGLIGRDSLRVESPAAQAELALLRSLKVGDVRSGKLFPALTVNVVWTLTHSTTDSWEFRGTFFGQFVYRLVVRVDAAMLTLDAWETV